MEGGEGNEQHYSVMVGRPLKNNCEISRAVCTGGIEIDHTGRAPTECTAVQDGYAGVLNTGAQR